MTTKSVENVKADDISPKSGSDVTINEVKLTDSSGEIVKIDNTSAGTGKNLQITVGTSPNFTATWITSAVGIGIHTNVGTGLGKIVKGAPTSISPIEHKSIKAGTNITVTDGVDDITLDVPCPPCLATSGSDISIDITTPAARQALIATSPTVAAWKTLIIPLNFGARVTATGRCLRANGVINSADTLFTGVAAIHVVPVAMRITEFTYLKSSNVTSHTLEVRNLSNVILSTTLVTASVFGCIPLTPFNVAKCSGLIVCIVDTGGSTFPIDFLVNLIGEYI